MALADYLTDDEWNACLYLYASHSLSGIRDFNAALREAVPLMLRAGLSFKGLDAAGLEVAKVSSSNAEKFVRMFFYSKTDHALVMSWIGAGRAYLLSRCPSLVKETDEDWGLMVGEVLRRHISGDAT